jgi:alkylated DNA repair dioxygenase AlkB
VATEQGSLFPEFAAGMPDGFRYEEEVLTQAEEAELVASIGELELKPFEFHGYTGNRRVKSFGFRYDYSRSEIEVAEEFPDFLKAVRAKATQLVGLRPENFRQGAVNEYRPGAGIGWHRDKPQFGIVVGISLLAPATMRFRRNQGESWVRRSQLLQPRSIYLLQGEVRKLWEHSIPPVDQLRYSLTFRTLSPSFQPPE